MHASDRVMANFWILVYVVLTMIFFGALASISGTLQRQGFFPYVLIAPFLPGSPLVLYAIYLFVRNYPVYGRNEDQVRRNIKQWYRDAKKWMDEHPEDKGEMKDL